MLLRDCLQPIPGDDTIQAAVVYVGSDSLYFEHRPNRNQFDAWHLPNAHPKNYAEAMEYFEGERLVIDNGTEFEAQLLLDHYLAEYGNAAA